MWLLEEWVADLIGGGDRFASVQVVFVGSTNGLVA